MSKLMQGSLLVGLLVFSVSAHAGVWLSGVIKYNSIGQDIYTLTANSDGAPITSLGINVVVSSGSSLGQVHPAGLSTELQNFNLFFAPAAVDEDTQAMFATAADNLLVVSGAIDTEYELDVNFTGFEPFTSRAIAQFVVIGEGAVCTVGVVAGGVEETLRAEYWIWDDQRPEPASLALLAVGSLAVIRRRRNS